MFNIFPVFYLVFFLIVFLVVPFFQKWIVLICGALLMFLCFK